MAGLTHVVSTRPALAAVSLPACSLAVLALAAPAAGGPVGASYEPPGVRAPFWPQPTELGAARVAARRLLRAPVTFQPNRGQTDRRVRYLSRGAAHALFLTPSEAVLAIGRAASATRAPRAAGPARRDVVRLRFPDANPRPRITSEQRLDGTANYLLGSSRSTWRTGLPTYGAVRYHALWPGIDVVFHGSASSLEYDFVVAPRGDVRDISLRLHGARGVRLDGHGDLLVRVGDSTIRQHRPVAYQLLDGRRRPVTSRYQLTADGRVTLVVGAYRRDRPLVIDPVLSYSTYLGGGLADAGYDIDIDQAGNVYVGGTTISADFPTENAIDDMLAPGGTDVFVTKLNAAGTAVLYSTYLGGAGDDEGYWLSVDRIGNASIVGQTGSLNFPTENARQPMHGGGTYDAYVARITADGSGLIFSTYLGGGGNDFAYGNEVDDQGNTYVTGETGSTNFPLANEAQPSHGGGGDDAFVTKLSASGTLTYSTFLGGAGEDDGQAVAVDGTGNAFVVGRTFSANFPTSLGSFDRVFGGVHDGFVTKLAPAGSPVSYSTYLGGADADVGAGVAVDGSGSAYVSGHTTSTDFPTAGALQPVRGAVGSDAFVTKVAPSGGTLSYSTYLGGIGEDRGAGIEIDAAGDAFVAGWTSSPQFPVFSAFQPALGGVRDAFVVRIAAGGDRLRYASYLGGNDYDVATGIAVDAAGNALVTGSTASTNFPREAPVQPTYGGGQDAFLAKIDGSDSEPPETTIVSAPRDPTDSSSAAFSFATSEPGPAARFECQLDGAPFSPCASPATYSGLSQGAHAFAVRATDRYNNTDPTPAQHAWAYDVTPPVARFTAAPNPSLAGRSVTFDGSGSSELESAIARYEWDLDGDGTFEVDGGASPLTTRAFADRGTYAVSLRVSDRAGLTATTRAEQRVSAVPGPQTVGVSINDGAQYTKTPRVTIKAVWPTFATHMLISNDGGFQPATTFLLATRTPWTLETTGAELLPTIVYVRFQRGLSISDYSDNIILDERKPVVTAARVTPAKGGGAPLLRLTARDRGLSGVRSAQVTNNRRDPKARYRATRATIKLNRRRGERRLTLRKPIYVRVRDRAGNVSAWRRAVVRRR